VSGANGQHRDSGDSALAWPARIARAVRTVETALIALLLGGLVLFASAQIVLRNVFSVAFTWSDGLTRLIVLWLALLGALAASRDDKHITMSVATQWLPPAYKRWMAAAANTFAALVCGALAYFSLQFVAQSREYGDTLLTAVPAWWLQSIMPFAFALMAFRFAMHAAKRLRGG
jgi:TRAP-type C4-dicarboxylate transport system permease small subunit